MEFSAKVRVEIGRADISDALKGFCAPHIRADHTANKLAWPLVMFPGFILRRPG